MFRPEDPPEDHQTNPEFEHLPRAIRDSRDENADEQTIDRTLDDSARWSSHVVTMLLVSAQRTDQDARADNAQQKRNHAGAPLENGTLAQKPAR